MKLKTTLLAFASLGIFVISACSSSANLDIDMKEGLWEISIKMEMAGMPFSLPPMTYTMCLTKDDIIPQQEESEGENCRVESQNIEDNTVSWKVVCDSSEGSSTTSGSITYRGDHFEGKMHLIAPGAEETISQSLSGRWIGECK